MARADVASASARSGFHQGAGAIDRQAGVSAAADRRAAAAPRGPGPDHRLSRHHRRRRGGAGARPPPRRRSATMAIDDRRGRRLRRRAPAATARQRRDATTAPQDVLARALPAWATAAGRRILLTNADGVVAAATPAADGAIGRRLIDLLGPTQPLTTFGAGAGVLEITLPDGTPRARDGAHAQAAVRPARGRAAAQRRARAPGARSPR